MQPAYNSQQAQGRASRATTQGRMRKPCGPHQQIEAGSRPGDGLVGIHVEHALLGGVADEGLPHGSNHTTNERTSTSPNPQLAIFALKERWTNESGRGNLTSIFSVRNVGDDGSTSPVTAFSTRDKRLVKDGRVVSTRATRPSWTKHSVHATCTYILSDKCSNKDPPASRNQKRI
jgi:hypothetical protein